MNTTNTAPANTAEPVSPASRRIARAILSTLTPDAAACVLATLAGLASAIINAASTLRHTTGEGATRAASMMLDAACDACELRDDTGAAAFAVCGAWFFDVPRGVVASFWRDDTARENVTSQARGVVAEVEALRAAPLARGGGEFPEGVERLDVRGVPWRLTSERATLAPVESIREHLTRHGLETALRSDAPVAARVLRVEAPPFASASKGVAASIGRALYFADPSVDGFADAASGLAGLTSELACSTDAAGLVAGLAQIAAHHAARGVEARTAQDASAYLGRAAEALDAARGAARLTLDALDAATPSTGTGDVMVRAA